MKKVLIAGLASILSLTAFADPSAAKLTCKSNTGNVIFTADLRPAPGGAATGQFSFGQQTLSSQDVQTVFDPANGVFTLYLEGSTNPNMAYNPTKLWAIPASFQALKQDKAGRHSSYTFKAKLHQDPKAGSNTQASEIEVNCQLEYDL